MEERREFRKAQEEDIRCFPGSSGIKNLPVSEGDAGDVSVSPGREEPLEKEMAAHSSILA